MICWLFRFVRWAIAVPEVWGWESPLPASLKAKLFQHLANLNQATEQNCLSSSALLQRMRALPEGRQPAPWGSNRLLRAGVSASVCRKTKLTLYSWAFTYSVRGVQQEKVHYYEHMYHPLWYTSPIFWSHYFRSALSLLSKQSVQRESPYLQAGLRALTKGKAESHLFAISEKEPLCVLSLATICQIFLFSSLPLQTESRMGSPHFTAWIKKRKQQQKHILCNFPFLPLMVLLLLRLSGLLEAYVRSWNTLCCLGRPFPKPFLKEQVFGGGQDWKVREGLEQSCLQLSQRPVFLHSIGQWEEMHQPQEERAGSGQRNTYSSFRKQTEQVGPKGSMMQHMEGAWWRPGEPLLPGSSADPARASPGQTPQVPKDMARVKRDCFILDYLLRGGGGRENTGNY